MISWNFIDKTLKYYNFGSSIRKWVKLFQKGSESCVIQNGLMSEPIKLMRGCRQGDQISPYLFIFKLAAGILGEMIRKNENIKCININNKADKLSQYADDTQIVLDGSEKALKETLAALNIFYTL